jgi:hypothetical protein
MNIDISQIGYRWKGIYSANLSYAENDVVYKDGGAYVIRSNVPVPFALGQQDAALKGHLLTGGLSAGGFGNMVLHSDGATVEFRFQDTRNGTLAIQLARSDLQASSRGTYDSAMAIMQDRSIRSWGFQGGGGTGTGTAAIGRTLPHRVPFPPGTPHIVDILRLWDDTFYLDAAGTVWHSGSNGNSIGGYGTTTDQPIPRKVNGNGDLGTDTKIAKLTGRMDYYDYRGAGFIDDAGRVYVTGQNALSRMGLGATTVDVNVPRLIPLTETVPMKDMFFGCSNNGATWLLSRTGQLYSCGEQNTSGRGGGNTVTHELWMPWGETNTVKEVVHSTSDEHWVAGAQYPRVTTALLDNGDLYMWADSGGYVSSGYGTGYAGQVFPSGSALHPYKVNEGVVTAASKNGGYHTTLCLMDDGSIQHSGHSATVAPVNVATWTTLDPTVFNNGTKLLMQGGQYVATATLLRSDGHMIMWGDGQGGRLGIGYDGDTNWTSGNATYPQLTKLEKTVVDFQPVGSSTPDTTGAGMQILTSDGGVYFVGSGNSSVNGDDDGQYSAVPRQIIF